MKNILIGVLVIAVIVLGYIAFNTKNDMAISPTPIASSEQTTTINNQSKSNSQLQQINNTNEWKIDGNDQVTFRYPPTWSIRIIDEPRPGSVFNAGYWIIPPGASSTGKGTDTGDAIVILPFGYGDSCEASSDLTRCTNTKNEVRVFTRSKNQTVLSVYDQLISTIE